MLVSGVGLVATWLARVPPATVGVDPSRSPSTVVTAGPPAIASEIVREADRLSRHNQTLGSYPRPARNPFRFGAAPVVRAPQVASLGAEDTSVAPAVAEIIVPGFRLSGLARDGEGEQEVRTAVLSTPEGIVLGRAGDPLSDGWTISQVEVEHVVLIGPDGTTLTLPLSGGMLRP